VPLLINHPNPYHQELVNLLLDFNSLRHLNPKHSKIHSKTNKWGIQTKKVSQLIEENNGMDVHIIWRCMMRVPQARVTSRTISRK
jgi:hypothetical protein